MAMLLPPFILVDEFWPMAVLKLLVVRSWRFSVPNATLHYDEDLAVANILLPIAVLHIPAAIAL